MINRFGSLSEVIQADEKLLRQVDGVGEESALFLNLLNDFMLYVLEHQKSDDDTSLDNTAKMVSYFRNHYIRRFYVKVIHLFLMNIFDGFGDLANIVDCYCFS